MAEPLNTNIRVNTERLWDSLMQMAAIGPGVAGGNNRQTLTDDDAKGRELFKSWCEQAGCTVGVDQIGTQFADRPGTDPTALPVCIGSHLDTQPTGGKYDGVLGVLAGLEIVRLLNDLNIKTRRPISVVNWTNEEGCRFAPPMLASGVFAGMYTLDWALDRQDAAGCRFGDELERIGFVGEETVGARKMHAFYELHIEQGPVLEAAGADVGVVTHGQGLRWLEFTLEGRESHTGSTPMPMRLNAGLGMARVTLLVDEIARANAPDAVGAVGHCDVFPNSRNIIPGKSVFTVDIRHRELSVLTDMESQVREGAQSIAEEIGLNISIEQVGGYDPVAFDAGCIDNVRRAADQLGLRHRDIVSGAGHDACWVNRVAPTCMVMCPCVDGLSHNEAEEITPAWASAGADVLLRAALESAEIVD